MKTELTELAAAARDYLEKSETPRSRKASTAWDRLRAAITAAEAKVKS